MATKKKKSEAIRFLEKLNDGPLTIGIMLDSHCKCEEISQAELARQLGITRQHLCNIIHGDKMVSPGRAAKFAQILGLAEKLWIKVALEDQLRSDGLHYTVTIDDAAA